MNTYDYPDPPPDYYKLFDWIANKIDEAMLHDPMVYSVYNLCKSRDLKDRSKEFYMLLAYNALKERHKMFKLHNEMAMKAINPPIIIQYKDELLSKDLRDKLEEMRDTRSWHQKMIDKLFRRGTK